MKSKVNGGTKSHTMVNKRKEDKIISYLYGKGNNLVVDAFSRNDVYVEDEDGIIIAEVKIRNFVSTKFKWFLELAKLNALMKLGREAKKGGKKVKVLYINHFKDDKIIVWDLVDILRRKRYTKTKVLMNRVSDPSFRNYGAKVLKDVLLLDIAHAAEEHQVKLFSPNDLFN